jgi:hypothetical protein
LNKFLIIAAAAMLLSGCGAESGPARTIAEAPSAPDAAVLKTSDSEVLDGNTYRIAAFGVTVEAPDGWHVVESDVMTKLMAAGTDVSTADMDSSTKAGVRGSIQRTTSLFTFMEVPPGSPREYIPAIMGLAEDVYMMPGVVRGEDYFFHVRRLMVQSTIRTVPSETSTEQRIDGKSFDVMDVQVGHVGAEINQRYYAARHGDNVVTFILSYRTDAELAVLDKVLASIKLDW